jgi:hypothetical protein
MNQNQEKLDAAIKNKERVRLELEDTIAKWQIRLKSACGLNEALELSDKFAEACQHGLPVPGWALAIRSMAGKGETQ